MLISFERQGKGAAVFAAALSLLGLILFTAPPPIYSENSAPGFLREDPETIVGAQACGECHVAELEVWKRTPHATGFKTLHRKASAERIARKMGFRLIKRDSLCIRCHYTPTEVSGQLRALSGVSCESCHGAGRNWIDIHNNYGGRGIDHSSESEEHRSARIVNSIEAGMRRPSLLYDVAKSCYGCHIVPEEELVNIGGHGTGSGSFEFVEWTQGEIRHNYLAAQRGGSAENIERSAARKRVMYVVGRAVELETALRGVAAAKTKGRYLKAMQRRVRVALGEVRAIGSNAEIPEINELARIVRGAEGVNLGNEVALIAAADQIGAITREIPNRYDGTKLAALDALVQGIDVSETPQDNADDDDAVAETDDVDAGADEVRAQADESREDGEAAQAVELTSTKPDGASGDAQATQASADEPEGGKPRVAPVPRVAGERKTRVRPASAHDTLGTECSNCHAPQNEWWFADDHYSTAEAFWDQNQRNVQIARFYGIKAKDIAQGNKVCMDCHGTIVSGRESREVDDGVGCESCHGAAGDYIESHREGDKSLGENRPGYQKGLQAGMVKLKDLETRARICAGCHYITEPRLISSGHPSGKDFQYVANMSRVRHWEHALAPVASLRQAFSSALSARGGVPDVPIAQASAGSDSAPSGTSGLTGGRSSPSATGAPRSHSERAPWRPPTPRPVLSSASETVTPEGRIARGRSGRELSSDPRARGRQPLELPDFPEIDSSTPIETILQQLKERLDQLHDWVYPP